MNIEKNDNKILIHFKEFDEPFTIINNSDTETNSLVFTEGQCKTLNRKLNTFFNKNVLDYKYELGSRVWVVYILHGEVSVYDDTLEFITVEADKWYYVTKEGCHELSEDEVIPYEDKDKLYDAIRKLMNEIKLSEATNGG